MIWALWIVSSLTGLEEPKWTLYDLYETDISCWEAWYEVTTNFTEGEVAFCGLSV